MNSSHESGRLTQLPLGWRVISASKSTVSSRSAGVAPKRLHTADLEAARADRSPDASPPYDVGPTGIDSP